MLDDASLGEGEARCVEAGGTAVMVVRREGALYALSNHCSHRGGPLHEGELDGLNVHCPWHDSVFDLRDGALIHGPAAYPQPAWDTRGQDGTDRSPPPVASPGVLDLLRPPPHRGPLIAAGAVVLATGLALLELRLQDELAVGVHFLVLGPAAAIVLALGLQAPNEDGRPPAYQSVLLVTGLLLLFPALLRLARRARRRGLRDRLPGR